MIDYKCRVERNLGLTAYSRDGAILFRPACFEPVFREGIRSRTPRAKPRLEGLGYCDAMVAALVLLAAFPVFGSLIWIWIG